MRCEEIFIAGIASWLPPTTNVTDAVASGAYDEQEQAANAYVSVAIAEREAPPQMAVRAGRLALERSGLLAEDVALVLHASVWFQGVDYWPTASYIHRNVLGGSGRRAPAMDMQQMSNGALAGVELAASYLAADPSRRAALVTVADRYQAPGFDRWRGLPGIVYGDGAAAVVLASGGGFARLLAVAAISDSRLEEMHRAGEPFGPVSGHAGWPVDLRARRHTYLGEIGAAEGARRTIAGLTESVNQALAAAELKLDNIARVVFPNIGLAGLRRSYLEPLGLDLAVTTWEWGRRTGHVGAADQLTGLAHLVETGHVNPGDRVMLVGIGAGFTWFSAIVELVARPSWATASGRAAQ